MDPRVFLCKGCHRERPRNPRLKPDEQSYCGSRRCQNARKRRSDAGRMRDPTYAADRREGKRAWRRRHAREDAAYRRSRRDALRSARLSEPPPQAPPEAQSDVITGRYLLQSLDDPGSPARPVHLVTLPGQVRRASETDAFPGRGGSP